MSDVTPSLEARIPPELLGVVSIGAAQRIVDGILLDVLEGARAKWIQLAGASFGTTARDYIASIQKPEVKMGVGTLALVGKLADVLENGRDVMYLHDVLLGPDVPEVPVGERGKHRTVDGEHVYRAIPFRHQTPGSEGTIAQRMGEAYSRRYGSDIAKKIGKTVHNRAKRLAPRDFDIGDPGERLESGYAPVLRQSYEPVKNIAGDVVAFAAPHSTDVYADMLRGGKQYRAAYGTQYTTFRTISTAVEDKWIRAPSPGRELAKHVSSQMDRLADMAFQSYLEGGE